MPVGTNGTSRSTNQGMAVRYNSISLSSHRAEAMAMKSNLRSKLCTVLTMDDDARQNVCMKLLFPVVCLIQVVYSDITAAF